MYINIIKVLQNIAEIVVDEYIRNNLCVCLCVVGRDGHKSHGILFAQQPCQLLQSATREQGAWGGREQRRGPQKNSAGNTHTMTLVWTL